MATIDPSFWEDGVNAAMLSYNANAWHMNIPMTPMIASTLA